MKIPRFIKPAGLQEIQVGGNDVINLALTRELSWTCTQQQMTLLPTSIERLSISLVLLFTQYQNTSGNNSGDCNRKEIKAVNIGGVNNCGNMDRGPMKFTSDVSLPKYDKTTIQGKKITAGQLTGL